MKGRLLAVVLAVATVVFVVIGTLHPVEAAKPFAPDTHLVRSNSTAAAALENFGSDIRAGSWKRAYDSLGNKAQFTETDFMHDMVGAYQNLRSYSKIEKFEMRPLHESDNDAVFRVKIHWATVVGDSVTQRDVHVTNSANGWQVDWPVQKEEPLPPQVIPVNYLRWDVIYRGAGDDWGAQDVEAPHVRIIDMHPVERAEGLVIMGELLNEDVVPAYVSVNATLLNKNQKVIASEGSFDKISHLLLPKAVTPFFIRFPNVDLSRVGSVQMHPFSQLIPASADPVIEVQNEKITPAPNATLTGEVVNQSGQVANIAHVLGTFYDKTGNLVWVADQYVDHALPPGTPEPFTIHIPEDLSKKISSQRTIVSTYSIGGAA